MTAEADKLLAEREKDFPANLLKAREGYLEAFKADDKNAELSAKLAQVMFWLGEYSEAKEDRDKYFGEGVEHGKKAVELAPEAVAAHVWYASNMGSHGLVRGIMSSLFYLGPIEKHAKKAVELDETYFEAAPLRLLGRFYHQAPGWPVGSGDAKKALGLLEKAVQVGPQFAYNHIYLAELYLSRGKKDDAKKLIEQALALPERPDMPIHYKRSQAAALEVQKQIG
ncbi:MAG: tetratricopeptide repeat protein [Spirochaetales bacterium]|nr:tetratricopeptide repeat protein [Leptospiraceae bacterium]MCP5482364.1 tetratricopeptide repeat protein [Spirochaetales bacterium]MCP5484197.1 tetratricopeptide repeat protein [Spirochaetales bacterium]